MRRTVLFLALSLSTAASLACPGCDGPSYPPYDRGALLRETADMVILPGIAASRASAADLHTSVGALCAAPDAGRLTAAREAWTTAFLAWRSTTAYHFGPARDMNLGPELATWPTNVTAIEANVAATDAIDAHYVDALGAGSKGLSALEYLLFAYPGYTARDDAMTLAALGETRRCAYAVALADHVERVTGQLETAWSAGGGNYVGTFVNAGNAGNTSFTSQQAAVDALVSQIREAVERTKVDRIGKPLGRTVATGGVESPYAHVSVASMQACVDGAHDAWTIAPHSPDAFLRTRNAALADEVLGQFAAASTALAALETPPLTPEWESYVSGADHAAGNAAYDALGLLERTLAGDVAATLGVSIVSAADGD